MEQSVARSAHNREVAGSSPAAAIHVRIQHHPARASLIPPLVAALGVDAEVVSDPDPEDRFPSPWRTYRECLAGPPPDVSHLLVLQDDATPCRNLVAACGLIAREVPVCLFLGGAPVRTAMEASRALRRGQRFVPVYAADWVPVVAILWPVEAASRFLQWCSENRLPGDPRPRSDDAVVGRWARTEREEVIATVPSLVQHSDVELSLIGRRARAGRSPWRVAHLWIGDEDPLDIRWDSD